MSQFLRNAQEILATARAAAGDDCDMTLLIGRDGGIRLVYEPGWAVESLREHHGAEAAYRVRRERGSVRVDAASRAESCTLATGREAEWRRHAFSTAPPGRSLPAGAF